MQDLLKDHLVEHLQENERYFFLPALFAAQLGKVLPQQADAPVAT